MADVLVPHEFATEVVRKHENPEFPFFNLMIALRRKATELPNSAAWDKIEASRTMAGFRNISCKIPGHQANRVKSTHNTNLAYQFEEKEIDVSTVRLLRKPGTAYERYGEDAITDELWDLDDICTRRAEWAIVQILTTGKISYNSGGVVFEVDFGQTSGHTPTVDTSWADASADIVGDILDIQKLCKDDGVGPGTDLWVVTADYKNMMNNSAVRELVRAQGGLALLESGKLPDILGVRIHRYDEGYATTQAGSTTDFLSAGYAIMTSDPSLPWWSFYEGDPNHTEAPPDHRGKFAYTYKAENGKGYHAQINWGWLPTLHDSGSVVYADIRP